MPPTLLHALSVGNRSTFRTVHARLQFRTKEAAVVYAEGMAIARHLRTRRLSGLPEVELLYETIRDLETIQVRC